ncbi:hypothetical protein BU26DRAFT_557633 [Trematosphaeria pertusa]|uniref:J domain-containing protein n=1 Tax=Trematosphaeria pertusa TaxID=390896 RepID=A0A6A6J0V9_9PLEO|nr:uncharacterized protein BU26DRAFT_557633 [Trematosphaeria pertusa]KAF2256158.1 hypothetical protein BU26DRAFT_557633 [Trematosphaeria pertusa]
MAPPPTTHYTLLALHPSASAAEIKKAWKTFMLAHHPDKLAHLTAAERAAGEALSKVANAAYECLSDPVERGRYDAEIRKEEQLREAGKQKRKREAGNGATQAQPPPKKRRRPSDTGGGAEGKRRTRRVYTAEEEWERAKHEFARQDAEARAQEEKKYQTRASTASPSPPPAYPRTRTRPPSNNTASPPATASVGNTQQKQPERRANSNGFFVNGWHFMLAVSRKYFVYGPFTASNTHTRTRRNSSHSDSESVTVCLTLRDNPVWKASSGRRSDGERVEKGVFVAVKRTPSGRAVSRIQALLQSWGPHEGAGRERQRGWKMLTITLHTTTTTPYLLTTTRLAFDLTLPSIPSSLSTRYCATHLIFSTTPPKRFIQNRPFSPHGWAFPLQSPELRLSMLPELQPMLLVDMGREYCREVRAGKERWYRLAAAGVRKGGGV